jgi:hypothetical protein
MSSPGIQLNNLIALAHHNWSAVELAMSELFVATVDMTDEKKAFALFNGIISFDVRLSMLDTLVRFESGFDEVEREMWARLSARLGRLYKQRHHIAHFMMPKDPNVIGIVPFATFEKLDDGDGILTPDEVGERAEKFVEACALVFWISRLARRLRPRSEKVPPLEVPEPQYVAQLRELAVQILEERKRPPKRGRAADET